LTDRTYAQALSRVLTPEGFTRKGRDWMRIRDGCCDMVYLQSHTYLGTTVDLLTRDLATEQILDEALPDEPGGLARFCMRLGHLIDGQDRWWRQDQNGPAELSDAVRVYGLPYFERFRSLEEQARLFGRFSPKWRVTPTRIYLAITLWRMGLKEEACEALSNPRPRTPPKWLARIEAVRRRLGCGPAQGAAHGEWPTDA
jgi:hypothetical protein